MTTRSRIAVVHLAWAPAGLDAFISFVRSLQANPPGMPHKLIVLYKGFTSIEPLQAYRDACADLEYEARSVPDSGYDIRWYLRTARDTDADYFCFLNSYSRALVPGWLAMLYDAVSKPGIGAVSATGSWESLYTDCRLSNGPDPAPSAARRVRWRLRCHYVRFQFPPWPNPHLRTNSLVISRSSVLSLHNSGSASKQQDLRFESGRHGLTVQLIGNGRQVRVVGRDGHAYEPEEWALSRTFRRAGHTNLLVSDNRTRHYDDADAAAREVLERLTWGPLPEKRVGWLP